MLKYSVFLLLLITSSKVGAAPSDPCSVNDPDHVTYRACQQTKVDSAMRLVAKAEDQVRSAIRNWEEDENWVDQSLELFEKSVIAFRAYQAAVCEVDASSAAGGNGAGDMRLSCEENLAKERIQLLAAQRKYFGE